METQLSKDKKIISIYPPHLQTTEFNLFDKYKTLNIYKFSKDFCMNQFKNLLLKNLSNSFRE